MQRLLRPAFALVVVLALGACSSTSTPAPAATTGSSAAPPPSAAASAGGAGASSAAACAPGASGAAATVNVTIKNFAFSPDPVTGKVGDAVGWTNQDSAGHTATLDDGTCTTDTIGNGATGVLVFSAPGTYAYHCNIHPTQMKGTITITG
jgi:plastocyanin